jgi:uncharacterized protein (TIGR02996 family)
MRGHPADDFTRWVYADWLEDRGDQRGAILRMADLPEMGTTLNPLLLPEHPGRNASHLVRDIMFRAIIAYPNDDALRIAYARLLEKNEKPVNSHAHRAEFIRAQIELSRQNVERQLLKKFESRTDALLHMHSLEWLGDLVKLGVRRATFSRGFPDEVYRTPQEFQANGEELFAAAPIQRLVVVLPRRHFGVGEKSERLQLFRTLAQSPHLLHLQQLIFHDIHIDSEEVGIIAESPYVRNIKELNIGNSSIKSAGAKALARSSQFSNLTTLDLMYSDLGTDGAKALCAAICQGRFPAIAEIRVHDEQEQVNAAIWKWRQKQTKDSGPKAYAEHEPRYRRDIGMSDKPRWSR